MKVRLSSKNIKITKKYKKLDFAIPFLLYYLPLEVELSYWTMRNFVIVQQNSNGPGTYLLMDASPV